MTDLMHLSIADRAYLLALDVDNGNLRGRNMHTSRYLRAAILADLAQKGAIADDNGRVIPTPGYEGNLDRVSAAAYAQIAKGKPRKWKDWIDKDRRESVDLLEEHLVARGVLGIEKKTVLLVVPHREITVHHPELIERLIEQVRGVVLGTEPVQEVPEDLAVLATLVTTAKLHHVVGRMDARRQRDRIKQLMSESGPMSPALRKAMQQADTVMTAVFVSAVVSSR